MRKLLLIPLIALMLAGCSNQIVSEEESCNTKAHNLKYECTEEFMDQQIFLDGGSSGGYKFFLSNGGSFCKPDSDNYPCRADYGHANYKYFKEIEDNFQWAVDAIKENKKFHELHELETDTGSIIKEWVGWEDGNTYYIWLDYTDEEIGELAWELLTEDQRKNFSNQNTHCFVGRMYCHYIDVEVPMEKWREGDFLQPREFYMRSIDRSKHGLYPLILPTNDND